MLGKVKKWLGIEGVKLEIIVEEEFSPRSFNVGGILRLRSKEAQTVSGIKIVLIERYSRGREDDQLIDEYQLGDLVMNKKIEVPAGGEPVDVPFLLPFQRLDSPMDEFAGKNPLFGGLAWAAKKLRKVTSEFRLEAEANIKGVGLNPFDKKILNE
ncbi:hypothetical protein CEQ90_05300 [Lewinellaceae bacterium SD302]|nr:hypothetical protein CEQ90_05300 [Lewinellaceae bacterium SD302]